MGVGGSVRWTTTEQFVWVSLFLSSSSVDHALAFCLGSPLFQLSSNGFSGFT
jgi:hypothetical protein